jgi:hypothetical protein
LVLPNEAEPILDRNRFRYMALIKGEKKRDVARILCIMAIRVVLDTPPVGSDSELARFDALACGGLLCSRVSADHEQVVPAVGDGGGGRGGSVGVSGERYTDERHVWTSDIALM